MECFYGQYDITLLSFIVDGIVTRLVPSDEVQQTRYTPESRGCVARNAGGLCSSLNTNCNRFRFFLYIKVLYVVLTIQKFNLSSAKLVTVLTVGGFCKQIKSYSSQKLLAWV